MRGIALALACLAAVPAQAAGGSVIERVRAEGVLHCGAADRAGIADAAGDAVAAGIAVDVCRALAIAVLGPAGRVTFGFYESPQSFEPLRRNPAEAGSDELAFLTGGEIAGEGLAGFLIPGPTVAIAAIAVMVPDASPARRFADLSGQVICFMTGSPGQRALEMAAAAANLPVGRLTFQEDVELLDAYNAGRCGGVVGAVNDLGEMRQNLGIRRTGSRLLPETLAADPVIAVTGVADGEWAALVAWVFDALLLADLPGDSWQAGGAAAHPAKALPGLRPDWRREVQAAVGSYADIVRRNLTERLGVAPGPNALWPAGLLLPPAVR